MLTCRDSVRLPSPLFPTYKECLCCWHRKSTSFHIHETLAFLLFPVSTRSCCFRNDLEEKTESVGESPILNTFLGSEKIVTNQEGRAGSSDKVVRLPMPRTNCLHFDTSPSVVTNGVYLRDRVGLPLDGLGHVSMSEPMSMVCMWVPVHRG